VIVADLDERRGCQPMPGGLTSTALSSAYSMAKLGLFHLPSTLFHYLGTPGGKPRLAESVDLGLQLADVVAVNAPDVVDHGPLLLVQLADFVLL